MSVKRRDLIQYLEKNGFYLLREGGKHAIYTNNIKVIPVKRLIRPADTYFFSLALRLCNVL